MTHIARNLVVANLITITDLNDDCLFELVKYLELADQLSLWQTTEIQSRLSSIICLTWQRVLTHSLNYATFETCEEILDEFVECIEDTVNVLELIDIPVRILEQWITKYNLSQVQSLACALSEEDRDNDSEYISKLQQLFPLVRCLQLREQLHVVETPIWDTADELWDMIATCPRLEVLYISGQKTDKWFFTWDRELMHYVLKTRARPLSLYFHRLEPHKELTDFILL
ncbi:uncharacterized protein Dwil_GK27986 [Drosophila willistoni]|uniref:F-box domain-containing protein n=1 Tax=Drosophila willistoni TaxID=7260 RepID=A0A0Q9X690_DROWI|nr:uncharacterized protein Dwil_GK27986 [Drosophila willistoni]